MSVFPQAVAFGKARASQNSYLAKNLWFTGSNIHKELPRTLS